MTALEALNLAAPLADTYMEVEQRLLVKIAQQLTLNDTHSLNEVSKWQIKQLTQMGLLKKDAAKIISSMTRGLPEDYADTIQAAIEATLAEDGLSSMWQNEEFSESAKQTIKHYRNQAADVYNQVNTVMQYKAGSSYVRAVNTVAEKMSEEMRRLQREIGNKQTFLDTLNSNTAAVVSGTTARTKAVRDTIHEMAKKGIPAFVDKLGREWSPEAYVNMDIRNTVKNTATSAVFGVMDSLGQDVFEVSSHPGSRPKCRPWQGKFISRSGRTTEITDLNGRKYKVYPLSQTSYGEPDGLFGINCGHRPRGVSDGLFTRTSKTSEEYGSDDEELYYKVCKQRELERKVRRSKTEADMLDAAGDAEGARAVRQKANQYNKELKGFCQQNGLKYRTDRVRTYGAIEPKKTLDKSAGSGIIEVGSEEMYRKNIGFKIEPMPKKQLHRIVKRFKERGGIIQFDEATDAYLESKNAEAITYNATTILLRRNAGRASVFEELIHATQYRNGENDGTYASRLRCEIAAQQKLIKYAKVYKLTENEIIQTKRALEAYEQELSEYIKNGGA